MTVLSHSGHGNSNSCFVGNWTCFQFVKDVSPLIQEASSVVTNWRGVAGFQTLCGNVLTELLGTGACTHRAPRGA